MQNSPHLAASSGGKLPLQWRKTEVRIIRCSLKTFVDGDPQHEPALSLAMTSPFRAKRFGILISTLLLSGGIGLLLHFGGCVVVSSDPLPEHTQVAVVLGGSIRGIVARRNEAMRLLQQGLADRVLMSIPEWGYWGEYLPEAAHRFFENKYGPTAAGRVVFCEMHDDVDSTADEALALRECLEKREWRSILVITSKLPHPPGPNDLEDNAGQGGSPLRALDLWRSGWGLRTGGLVAEEALCQDVVVGSHKAGVDRRCRNREWKIVSGVLLLLPSQNLGADHNLR